MSPVFNSGGSPPWWGLNLFWHGTERASYECCWCRATSLVNVNECCWCRSTCLVNDPYVIRVICFRHPSSVIKASTEHHSSKHSSMTPALFRHHSGIIQVIVGYEFRTPKWKHSSTTPASFRHQSCIFQASMQHHSGIIQVILGYEFRTPR